MAFYQSSYPLFRKAEVLGDEGRGITRKEEVTHRHIIIIYLEETY